MGEVADFQAMLRARDAEDTKVLQLIPLTGPMYVVEVADEIGVPYHRARAILKRLYERKLLKSWLESSPRGGMQRRYYDLITGGAHG